jgi:hypothetical protein
MDSVSELLGGLLLARSQLQDGEETGLKGVEDGIRTAHVLFATLHIVQLVERLVLEAELTHHPAIVEAGQQDTFTVPLGNTQEVSHGQLHGCLSEVR